MKFNYLEQWMPCNYGGWHQPGSPRGDEKREFRLEDGRTGKLVVDHSMGGWNWSVQIEGKTIACNRSWGERSKVKAKSLAIDRLRQFAEDPTIKFQAY